MSSSESTVDRQRHALLALVQLDKSDLANTLPKVLASTADALEVERVSYWSLADDRSRIACEQLFRRTSRQLSGGGVLEAAAYPRYFDALLEHRTIRASDARVDPRTAEFNVGYFDEHGITSMLDIPIWQDGRLAGVVCHEHVGAPRAWQDSEVDFTLSVGGLLASMLEAQARRRAETRYALLTTALRDLVWDWDLTTGHIAWNKTALDFLRFAPGQSEPSFQWWQAHVHPDDVDRVVEGLERHAKAGDGVWRDEYRFRRGEAEARQAVLDRLWGTTRATAVRRARAEHHGEFLAIIGEVEALDAASSSTIFGEMFSSKSSFTRSTADLAGSWYRRRHIGARLRIGHGVYKVVNQHSLVAEIAAQLFKYSSML